jgi:hypothetical protein
MDEKELSEWSVKKENMSVFVGANGRSPVLYFF